MRVGASDAPYPVVPARVRAWGSVRGRQESRSLTTSQGGNEQMIGAAVDPQSRSPARTANDVRISRRCTIACELLSLCKERPGDWPQKPGRDRCLSAGAD